MKVYVNNRCLNCGMCVRFHPDCFEIINNKAEVKKDVDIDYYSVFFADAADSCPVDAIILEKD